VALAPAIAARLEELSVEYELPNGAVDSLSTLLIVLSDQHAPTTVREPASAVEVHVADSLSGLPLLRGAHVVADLGSGAGLPALVIATALPECRVTAVESVRRKTEFISSTAESMGLTNLHVAWSRAEEWSAGRGICDVVCARALAPLNVLCEYAAPLLRLGGTLVSWKGKVEGTEGRDALAAAAELGLGSLKRRPVRPFPGSERRSIWTATKEAETPPRYPRRAGMALKRPITATTP
jgi:16S rRNA (guanine527-N7)-methyltransferase